MDASYSHTSYKYDKIPQEIIFYYIDILRENNINCLFTRSTGREINAGCEQLKSSILKNI